ncbi:MAG: CHAD domain-containing protein [Pseudomonadota bacterium]
MTVEIELKLALPAHAARRLRAHPLLKSAPVTRKVMYGLYFDTPELDLFRRKGAFRLRREGYHWVQTVKLDRGSVGGLSVRPEYEVAVAGNQPDFTVLPEAARAALTPDIEARLAPVFSTEFRRTAWLLELETGRVEVALDLGHIRAGDADLPVSEVELELLDGDGACLFDVARQLLVTVPLVPEYRSKALRGYALLGAWQERPCKAMPVAVEPGLPAAEVWRLSFLAALAQFGHNLPGLLAQDDPEYLHQTRVAVRRMRTLLSLGRGLELAAPAWREALRGFMTVLSPARDLDVLVTETLARAAQGLPEPDRLAGLVARAEVARIRARRQARAAAGSTALTALTLDMGAALLDPRQGGPDALGWARQALDRRWRTFRKLAKQFDALDAEGRHRLRLLAKRLRYTGELLAPLFGRRAERFLDQVAEAQDRLGVANDVAVAHRLLADLDRDGHMAYARGLVEGFIAAGAHVDQAAVPVRRVLRARPFWR